MNEMKQPDEAYSASNWLFKCTVRRIFTVAHIRCDSTTFGGGGGQSKSSTW